MTIIGLDESNRSLILTDWLVINLCLMNLISQPHIRQRRKEARPAELTAAALELFVEKGFAGTRLDDVASRAGVSKGTLYLYFDSKEALFKAVIQEGIVPVLEEGSDLVDGHKGSASQLLRLMVEERWPRIGDTHLAGLPKLMMSEARNFPELAIYYHDTVIVRGKNLIRAILKRGMVSGEFRPVDMETTIDVILAPLLMQAIWRYSLGACCGTRHDARRYQRTHLDLVLYGLANPDQAPKGKTPK